MKCQYPSLFNDSNEIFYSILNNSKPKQSATISGKSRNLFFCRYQIAAVPNPFNPFMKLAILEKIFSGSSIRLSSTLSSNSYVSFVSSVFSAKMFTKVDALADIHAPFLALFLART